MKLKKFFKPLVTVSALSMLLMGCAEDSSNSGGSTTPPTAESVFSNFLAGFQSAPAQNDVALEFTTKTTDKKPLNVAKDAEADKYLVSLDNVMATYYATFGITGTSTLLTGEGSDLSSSGLTKITHYAKVDKGSDTASIDLTLNNGTNSLYTGMFALMTADEVTELDTALDNLQTEIDNSKGEGDTPVLANVDVAAVQNVVDLINGNMYKVAYNSPAQSVQTAFAAAQPLTLKNGMAFTEGDGGSTFEIAVGKLSYEDANPAIENNKVVVFLDEFKNKLNGVTASSEDTVKGKNALTTNTSLGITTDTASSNANAGEITYTPATKVVAGAKVTYIAILDATTDIDSNASAFGTLNGKMTTGATKAEVEAALAELGTIYTVEYTVDTIANLIETFKASVGVEGAKTLTENSSNYEATIKDDGAFESADVTVYCLSVSTDTPRLVLNKLGGNATTAEDALANYVLKAKAKGSDGDGKITFTLNGTAQPDVPLYAYCSAAENRSSSGDAFDTALQTGTNYEKLNAFFQALQEEGVEVYSYTKTAE